MKRKFENFTILISSIVIGDRARKHRYVYINAKKKRRKELLSKLNYNVLSYPKSLNETP